MHRDWAIQTGGFFPLTLPGSILPSGHMACELRNIMPYDSLRQYHGRDARWLSTWFGRKLRKEHLFQVRQDVFDWTLIRLSTFEWDGNRSRAEMYSPTRVV